MVLNISQTKVMYISSRRKQHIIDTSDTDICYKKSTVSASPNEKLYGVTLTNTLCWDTHIENDSKPATYTVLLFPEIKCFFNYFVKHSSTLELIFEILYPMM